MSSHVLIHITHAHERTSQIVQLNCDIDDLVRAQGCNLAMVGGFACTQCVVTLWQQQM